MLEIGKQPYDSAKPLQTRGCGVMVPCYRSIFQKVEVDAVGLKHCRFNEKSCHHINTPEQWASRRDTLAIHSVQRNSTPVYPNLQKVITATKGIFRTLTNPRNIAQV
jgi:hypothetical protein